MPASPNDPRTKRRKAAGDDVNKMAMAPQPLPGMPQDQKAGNSMNNPMFDTAGQMSQKIGAEPNSFTYGDMKLPPNDARMGAVGFNQRSNAPQNVVPGRGMNQVPYNLPGMSLSLDAMTMMEPVYDMNSAVGKTMPNGINNGQPVSYGVTALGPTGSAAPGTDPGAFPPQVDYSMSDTLPVQGTPDAQAAVGMSTGRGGGRNKKT